MSFGERLRRVVSPEGGAHRSGRLSRLGLRARITASFALGALVLAILISTITYVKTSSSIVGGDERSYNAQAIANATAARSVVYARNPNGEELNALSLVNNLKTTTTFTLVYLADLQQWFSSSPVSFTSKQLPISLRDETIAGLSSEQTFRSTALRCTELASRSRGRAFLRDLQLVQCRRHAAHAACHAHRGGHRDDRARRGAWTLGSRTRTATLREMSLRQRSPSLAGCLTPGSKLPTPATSQF